MSFMGPSIGNADLAAVVATPLSGKRHENGDAVNMYKGDHSFGYVCMV
jgi:hypothetical protein